MRAVRKRVVDGIIACFVFRRADSMEEACVVVDELWFVRLML
jgi:hypothetical protein